MLKIIGIPAEEDALSLYNKWKAERDEWNHNATIHNRIFFWTTTSICLLLIVGVFWLSDWSIACDEFAFFQISALVGLPVFGALIVLLNWHSLWEYNEFSWPMQYKYYVQTKDKTILESKVKNGTLELILENENHEVSLTCLGGFSEKIRTDIDEIIVDINKEEILIPYKHVGN